MSLNPSMVKTVEKCYFEKKKKTTFLIHLLSLNKNNIRMNAFFIYFLYFSGLLIIFLLSKLYYKKNA